MGDACHMKTEMNDQRLAKLTRDLNEMADWRVDECRHVDRGRGRS